MEDQAPIVPTYDTDNRISPILTHDLHPKDAGIVLALGIMLSNGVGMVFRSSFLASIFAMVPTVLLARDRARRNEVPLTEVFPMSPVPLSRLLRPLPVFLCLKVAEVDSLSLVDYLLGGRLSALGEMVPTAASHMSFVQMLIVTAIAAPIAEELVFRGFCYRCFKDWNVGWAAIFPSLIFACFHNPLGIPSAFVAGMLFSVIAARERSLRASMLIHAVTNGVLMIFSRLEDGLSATGLVILVVFIHVLAVAIVIMDRRYIKSLWLELRALWRQFVERPQFGIRIRTIAKHWSYVLILLYILIITATIMAIPFLESHMVSFT